MNPHYLAFIDHGKALARQADLLWEIPTDSTGTAIDSIGWNLTQIAGYAPPPIHYLRDFRTDSKTLQTLNHQRVEQELSPLSRSVLRSPWQDLIKAAALHDALVKRNAPNNTYQCVVRALRAIATCTDKAPWDLTADDARLATKIATLTQPSGAMGRHVTAIFKSLFDLHHLCDVGPLHHALVGMASPQPNDRRAKHTKPQDELRASLVARKSAERLPERRAFWELIRIVLTEQPRSFTDAMRFAALKVQIMTGLRAGEVALLPLDWRRVRSHIDFKGNSAAEAGGFGNSVLLRHFAEKQHLEGTQNPILFETAQPVPEMFREILEETLEYAQTLTTPLRQTLKLQCETGRIFPWYPQNSIVPAIELYQRLTGNAFWLDIEKAPFVTRYRQQLDPSVLHELRQYQRNVSSNTTVDWSVYVFFHRLQKKILNGATTLTLRRGDGSIIPLGHRNPGPRPRVSWKNTYLHVGEFEDYVRQEVPTKISDTHAFQLSAGLLHPWELLFLTPKRSLAEERNEGLCDVTICSSINRPDPTLILSALAENNQSNPSLFSKYGQTEEDRSLKLVSHTLRHLQNTELFRLGIADTIISKRFNRRSVAQSYEYDHRSLSEELEAIEIPEHIETMLGSKATTVAKLIMAGRASGPVVEGFQRIQSTDGEQAAYEYLRAEADGFHVTPYGHCLNSFTVSPCPKHLECFANCKHLSAVDLPEHRRNLTRLEQKLQSTIDSIKLRPSTSIGWKNQLQHAEIRLDGVRKLLATPPGGRPFPDGVDLSKPTPRGVLDD